MGLSASKTHDCPPQTQVPHGKVRLCVASYTLSTHGGRAHKIAHHIATHYSDTFESWYYFDTPGRYSRYLIDVFEHVPFPLHLKGHSTSPFVWVEAAPSTIRGHLFANLVSPFCLKHGAALDKDSPNNEMRFGGVDQQTHYMNYRKKHYRPADAAEMVLRWGEGVPVPVVEEKEKGQKNNETAAKTNQKELLPPQPVSPLAVDNRIVDIIGGRAELCEWVQMRIAPSDTVYAANQALKDNTVGTKKKIMFMASDAALRDLISTRVSTVREAYHAKFGAATAAAWPMVDDEHAQAASSAPLLTPLTPTEYTKHPHK